MDVIVVLSEDAYEKVEHLLQEQGATVFRRQWKPRRQWDPKEVEGIRRYLEELRKELFPGSEPIGDSAVYRLLDWSDGKVDEVLDDLITLSLGFQKQYGPIRNWGGHLVRLVSRRTVKQVRAWAAKERERERQDSAAAAPEAEPEPAGVAAPETGSPSNEIWKLDPVERLRRLREVAQ